MVLDACTLVPVTLADTMLRLAEVGLYRPLWNARILAETVFALERIHPDMKTTGAAQRRIEVMRRAFHDACVSGWEGLVGTFELPDENDQHVVATAVRGRADLIVTANVKDFPDDILGYLELAAQRPDDFLLNQLDLDPQGVMQALHLQAAATRHPRLRVPDILDRLAACDAAGFAKAARGQLWRIPDGGAE